MTRQEQMQQQQQPQEGQQPQNGVSHTASFSAHFSAHFSSLPLSFVKPYTHLLTPHSPSAGGTARTAQTIHHTGILYVLPFLSRASANAATSADGYTRTDAATDATAAGGTEAAGRGIPYCIFQRPHLLPHYAS